MPLIRLDRLLLHPIDEYLEERENIISSPSALIHLPPIRALYATPTLQILLFAAAAKHSIILSKYSSIISRYLPTSPAHLVPCLEKINKELFIEISLLFIHGSFPKKN